MKRKFLFPAIIVGFVLTLTAFTASTTYAQQCVGGSPSCTVCPCGGWAIKTECRSFGDNNSWCCIPPNTICSNTDSNCGAKYQDCDGGVCSGGENCTLSQKVCVNGACYAPATPTPTPTPASTPTPTPNATPTPTPISQGTITGFTSPGSYTLGQYANMALSYQGFPLGMDIVFRQSKRNASGTYDLINEPIMAQTNNTGSFLYTAQFPPASTDLIGTWQIMAKIGTQQSSPITFTVVAPTTSTTPTPIPTPTPTPAAGTVTIASDLQTYPENGAFIITINGGTVNANKAVDLLWWKDGVAYNGGCGAGTWCAVGTTDATGKLELRGKYTSALIGSWMEQARIGTKTSNVISFRVVVSGGSALVTSLNKIYFKPGETLILSVSGAFPNVALTLRKWGGPNQLGDVKSAMGTAKADGTFEYRQTMATADVGRWSYVVGQYDSFYSAPMDFSVGLTDIAVPQITSISPSSGAAPIKLPYIGGAGSQGDLITINGTNFGPGTSFGGYVMFTAQCVSSNGATNAGIESWSDTKITVRVPWKASSGPVYIWKSDAIKSNSVGFLVTTPCPSEGTAGVSAIITSIAPTSAAIGNTVTITGRGFGPQQYTTGDKVIMQTCSTSGINPAPVTVASWSDTRITLAVPANGASGDVWVLAAGQQSNALKLTVTNSTCSQISQPPVPSPIPGGSPSCTNPSQVPTGFAAPCPVFGAASPTTGANVTVAIAPIAGSSAHYVYRSVYVTKLASESCPAGTTAAPGGAWCLVPMQLTQGSLEAGSADYVAKNTSAVATLNLNGFARGQHWVALWDWNWNATLTKPGMSTAGCYVGPAGTGCFVDENNMGGATWRIQLVNIP